MVFLMLVVSDADAHSRRKLYYHYHFLDNVKKRENLIVQIQLNRLEVSFHRLET